MTDFFSGHSAEFGHEQRFLAETGRSLDVGGSAAELPGPFLRQHPFQLLGPVDRSPYGGIEASLGGTGLAATEEGARWDACPDSPCAINVANTVACQSSRLIAIATPSVRQ